MPWATKARIPMTMRMIPIVRCMASPCRHQNISPVINRYGKPPKILESRLDEKKAAADVAPLLLFQCSKPEGGNVNEDILKGNWKQLRGKVKQWWGELTDDDLDRVDGSVDELAGRLQERYGYERDEAEREIERRLEAYS